ncbi:MAG TPA: IS1380 family transposase [Propionibacterium sp.]|nr:IS1380 family transposase [Propionibacterium sp.]
MKVCHSFEAVFDDPNLVSCGGLAAVMGLAEQAGLHELAGKHVKVPGSAGANAALKIPALVAGMIAGADSISDLDVLRHGGMGRVFSGLRAPTTLGTHLRGYTFGHVRQLDAVASRVLVNLAHLTPILDGADQVTWVDVDDTIRETHGYQKQGAAYGYTKVKGLNAALATISTPLAAPVIAATRLRKGNVASAHGAARLISDSLATLRRAVTPSPGLVIVRADSAYFTHAVVAAARRGGARFSITARMNKAVTRAIAAISDTGWTPIQYPNAIYDDDQQAWISDAEVAEIGFTAFTSRRKTDHVTARLIVRRVKRLNPHSPAQGELLPGYRYHAVFTDSTLGLVAAEACHRDHAHIEQVIADLKDGALAHAPSGQFTANSAWLVLAAIAFNLTRAAARIASTTLGRARTATVRRTLITVAARVANQARRWRLHLPRDWPWQTQLEHLHSVVAALPAAASP